MVSSIRCSESWGIYPIDGDLVSIHLVDCNFGSDPFTGKFLRIFEHLEQLVRHNNKEKIKTRKSILFIHIKGEES